MNRYLYALANPATLVDPSGHAACIDVGTTCVPSVEGNNQLAKNKATANRQSSRGGGFGGGGSDGTGLLVAPQPAPPPCLPADCPGMFPIPWLAPPSVDDRAALHASMDVCGIVNPFCSVADAKFYAEEGKYAEALLALLTALPLTKLAKRLPAPVAKLFVGAGKWTPDLTATQALRSKALLAFDDIAAVSFRKVVYRGRVDLGPTLEAIAEGKLRPRDLFDNQVVPGALSEELPVKPIGYYLEYVVPTPGVVGPGPMRLVIGGGGEIYFTAQHYAHNSFWTVWKP
jgi:hypothetical protein